MYGALITASELFLISFINCVSTYLGLVVFQSVSLVHHQAGPVYGAQDCHVDGDQLVGGQQDVELDRRVFLLEETNTKKRVRVSN